MVRKDQVKLLSLAAFIVGMVAVLLTGERAVETAHAFSSGPPGGRTGAPGELTCATSDCHGGSPNSGQGQFSIQAPSSYEPGQTYQITVRHTTSETSRRRWGFQLTALTAANARAGNLQNLSGQTSILNDDGPGLSRQYIEHGASATFQGQSSQASWTFNWIAPSSDVGPVTFYAAGNQANNDGTSNGDQIYTRNVTVNPAAQQPPPTTGRPEIANASVSGKKLLVLGRNFAPGADMFIGEEKQKKTSNDLDNPTTLLVAKKSGKKVGRGQEVVLRVRNPDGQESEPFTFRRPE